MVTVHWLSVFVNRQALFGQKNKPFSNAFHSYNFEGNKLKVCEMIALVLLILEK